MEDDFIETLLYNEVEPVVYFLSFYLRKHKTIRMAEGKCTFGTRAPIDIHMLNEIIYREVKHFRNYKIYRPNFGAIPVTAKFYASHDQLKAETREETKMVDDYRENVAQTRAKGPLSKYTSPVTENQAYGWYTAPLVPTNRSDKRFFRPIVESKPTKIEIVIFMSNTRRKDGSAPAKYWLSSAHKKHQSFAYGSVLVHAKLD
ncbi:hypothetical protein PYW07_009484 [Mythimna separata]|uniref:Uncharacterized protein n=1 Tax=Mythimna separata TaxID=271217 RepID=A0AAD8DMC4_MYTSE|nr:hypothetical protein PYW07_009484 [Mythimna separata]